MISQDKLKIYFASSSRFIKEVVDLACAIQAEMLKVGGKGIEITRTWWKYHHEDSSIFGEYTDMEYYSHSQVRLIQEMDKKAIDDADIVIVYNENRYKLGGAVWEMGYAEGVGTPVLVIGEMKRSAMFAGAIFAKTEEELIETLKRWIN